MPQENLPLTATQCAVHGLISADIEVNSTPKTAIRCSFLVCDIAVLWSCPFADAAHAFRLIQATLVSPPTHALFADSLQSFPCFSLSTDAKEGCNIVGRACCNLSVYCIVLQYCYSICKSSKSLYVYESTPVYIRSPLTLRVGDRSSRASLLVVKSSTLLILILYVRYNNMDGRTLSVSRWLGYYEYVFFFRDGVILLCHTNPRDFTSKVICFLARCDQFAFVYRRGDMASFCAC